MNASFRTAFWAMCLGLMVPMVLFIGAEVIAPGSTSRKAAAAAAADRIENLQTRLHVAAAKPSTRRSRTDQLNSQAGKTLLPLPGDTQSKMTAGSGQDGLVPDANGDRLGNFAHPWAGTDSNRIGPQG